jgi:hypothetical protein
MYENITVNHLLWLIYANKLEKQIGGQYFERPIINPSGTLTQVLNTEL